MSPRRLGRAVLLALTLAAGVISLSGPSAFGFFGHTLISQITQAEGSPISQPWGLAFDASGNLFVAGSEQTDVFDAANTFQGSLGAGTEENRGYGGHNVAVDRATGDVYVAETGIGRVFVFKPAGAGKYILLSTWEGHNTPGGTFGGGSDYVSVAIDNSTSASDPHAGDVYVMTTFHPIYVFKPKPPGAEEAQEGELVGELSTAGFALPEGGVGTAVDASTGTLYVPDAGNHAVDEFDGEGTFVQAFKGASESFAPFAVAVEESTHDIYVIDSASGTVDEFDSTGKQIEGEIAEPLVSPEGVAVDSSGEVYVSDAGANPPAVDIFSATAVHLPDVTTGSAETKKGGAKLEGVVDPGGEEVTSCEFEYGTSTAYGHTVACSSAPGSGSSPVPVTAEVTGLESETIYHYRLVAGNANGTHDGRDQTLTTPATLLLLTEAVTEVLGTTATLNGIMLLEGLDTHDWFEYGLTKQYGTKTPREDAGAGEEIKFAVAPVTNLEPNTSYHFRFAAENTFGVTYGADETFTTEAVAPRFGQPLPVTAIDRTAATVSGSINPEKSNTTYRIDYGETSSYGDHSPEFEAGEGLGEQPIAVGLQNLEPGRTYHYEVQATNQAGTVTTPDETFTTSSPTPPTATTGGASNLALTTAAVSGTIGPEGLETSYELDFGTSTEYGTSISGEAGAGSEPINIEVPLRYLAPGTTYHYRFVAINSDGRTYGADETFTTPAYSAPIILPSTLPLITTPTIAFPTETEPTQQKAAKKKTTEKKHRKGRGGKKKGKRAKKAKRKR
jgi:hypothetical protein